VWERAAQGQFRSFAGHHHNRWRESPMSVEKGVFQQNQFHLLAHRCFLRSRPCQQSNGHRYILVPICSRCVMHPKVILLSRRRRKPILTSLPGAAVSRRDLDCRRRSHPFFNRVPPRPGGVWPWPGGNLRRGFLICVKNQGRQMVKKIHLGRTSYGTPPCPHAWGWLVGKRILNTEKSVGEGRSRL
jgi:hypothetical protein